MPGLHSIEWTQDPKLYLHLTCFLFCLTIYFSDINIISVGAPLMPWFGPGRFIGLIFYKSERNDLHPSASQPDQCCSILCFATALHQVTLLRLPFLQLEVSATNQQTDMECSTNSFKVHTKCPPFSHETYCTVGLSECQDTLHKMKQS